MGSRILHYPVFKEKGPLYPKTITVSLWSLHLLSTRSLLHCTFKYSYRHGPYLEELKIREEIPLHNKTIGTSQQQS